MHINIHISNRRPFQIQGQQTAEDFFVGHFGGVVGPVVGGGDGLVERLVGEVEPGGAGVVEVGQGAFFQVGFVAGFGDRAFREAGFFFFRGDHPIDPLGRVEPGFAQLVEAAGGSSDDGRLRMGGGKRAGIGLALMRLRLRNRASPMPARRIARRQAGWEWEGFEDARTIVATGSWMVAVG
jgi:hypothetical protein